MKKSIKNLVMLGALVLTLGACQNNQANQETVKDSTEISSTVAEEKITVTLEIKTEDSADTLENLKVSADENLLAILEENAEVVAEDGFITSINGVEQDAAAGYYWTFTINDEWGEKGANETFLENGDKVVFSYGKL
ncbi:hypothetical protein M2139_002444 [Enterococcus sp. PF1-24]|uniref:DUF4430 domain-containing protein n=1 Tax=unclassified Enterococcus TaxID=2608891 RepID=UPI002475D475|nr:MULTISPECIES: DUF4430 domain-containing protein [unclassified Enterococcus]MDH6365441.1 hypothetical protein [Enterococcus sp. PFB1-1]MDH6402542.1 hypothetical protein [Enterococcus sp. PF1-24]